MMGIAAKVGDHSGQTIECFINNEETNLFLSEGDEFVFVGGARTIFKGIFDFKNIYEF